MQVHNSENQYNHTKNDHYIVQDNAGFKCICETCSCGKHHCPKRIPKTDFETSYARYYQAPKQIQPIDKRPLYRYEERHYSPDVLKTNYQQHYQPQPILYPQPGMSNSRLQQVGKTIMSSQIPFMGVSSYKDQYQPYNLVKRQDSDNPEIEVLQSMKSQQYHRSPPKFQGISSYKSQFQAPPEPKRQEPKPGYKVPDAPFYGSTTYKEQYKPVQIVPFEYQPSRSPYKNFKTVKFEGKSAYKQQFVPYQNQVFPYDPRMQTKNACKLDQVVVPKINYINDRDHVMFDPESKRFF